MRTLWDQHMQWTYDTVVAFAANSPGLQPTIDRILSNQVDIGNAIAPYYGEAAATQLTDLLTTHIKEAVPVLTAAKAGDTPALNKAVQAWYANAQDIADFLAKANPNWKKGDMRNMMKSHITQTIGYASDILTGNYAKAISDYDTAQAHMAEWPTCSAWASSPSSPTSSNARRAQAAWPTLLSWDRLHATPTIGAPNASPLEPGPALRFRAGMKQPN